MLHLQKRRAIYEDLAIAVGLPILVLILRMWSHYESFTAIWILPLDIIVQPHRFDIIEEYGCSIATYNTLPSYFLFYMWPVLLGSISFGFSSAFFLCYSTGRTPWWIMHPYQVSHCEHSTCDVSSLAKFSPRIHPSTPAVTYDSCFLRSSTLCALYRLASISFI